MAKFLLHWDQSPVQSRRARPPQRPYPSAFASRFSIVASQQQTFESRLWSARDAQYSLSPIPKQYFQFLPMLNPHSYPVAWEARGATTLDDNPLGKVTIEGRAPWNGDERFHESGRGDVEAGCGSDGVTPWTNAEEQTVLESLSNAMVVNAVRAKQVTQKHKFILETELHRRISLAMRNEDILRIP